MTVTQISIGRFWYFHLARQLERLGMLDAIYTGYPRFKLRDELGIPQQKIRTYPWLHTPYMARGRFGLGKSEWLNREWAWWAHRTLDNHVARQLKAPGVLMALSGSGLASGKRMQQLGGYHICDRGSSHIVHQDGILGEEYERWGLRFKGVDPRAIAKEQSEYAAADHIIVPCRFAKQTFVEQGVDAQRISPVPFGANLARFSRKADPDRNAFQLVWVGAVSIRKGFLYALRGFQQLQHPNKRFVVIGSVLEEMKALLKRENLDGVTFKGIVPNVELADYYSRSHAFILTSIEEGLALVQGEALACGCPVIATPNTGCEDLFQDAQQGFIIPIRDPNAIAAKLQLLADDFDLRERMSAAAIEKMKSLGGWDQYGDAVAGVINGLDS